MTMILLRVLLVSMALLFSHAAGAVTFHLEAGDNRESLESINHNNSTLWHQQTQDIPLSHVAYQAFSGSDLAVSFVMIEESSAIVAVLDDIFPFLSPGEVDWIYIAAYEDGASFFTIDPGDLLGNLIRQSEPGHIEELTWGQLKSLY